MSLTRKAGLADLAAAPVKVLADGAHPITRLMFDGSLGTSVHNWRQSDDVQWWTQLTRLREWLVGWPEQTDRVLRVQRDVLHMSTNSESPTRGGQKGVRWCWGQ
jgi:hypothetical protein